MRKYALNGHPFDWQFPIGFLMVYIPRVNVSTQPEITYLTVLVVAHQKNVSTSKISVNDPVFLQIFL